MMFVERARQIRRGYPIHGYVGPNGSGKTACAVYDSLLSLANGRKVLSTVRLLDFTNPRKCDDPDCTSPDHARHMAAHPLYVPWTHWEQLMDAHNMDILADEITGVASSREYGSLPGPVANKLMQLRRSDCVFRWTAPSWSRADVLLREVSQAVTLCKGFFPKESSDGDRLWRQRRGFLWKTYDVASSTGFDAEKREKLQRLAFSFAWGPSLGVFDAYDTYDDVSPVGVVTPTGACMACGGRRSAPRCHCDT